jgi:hypothetical protein
MNAGRLARLEGVKNRMMGYTKIATLFLLLAACVTVGGCAEKKTRGVTVKGPDSEVKVEVETTDRDPDD